MSNPNKGKPNPRASLLFEDRAKNPEKYPYIKNADGSISTHRMAAEVDEHGNWYAFPTIVMRPDGQLHQFDENFQAMKHNMATGNIKKFGKDKKAALEYAEGGYKGDKLNNFSKNLSEGK